MHVHSPNLLQGPISRRRLWWNISDDDIMEAMSKLPPCQDVPIQKNVGKKPRRPIRPLKERKSPYLPIYHRRLRADRRCFPTFR